MVGKSPTTDTSPRMARLAVLLAALAMVGPFAIDTYLPSFPAMQAGLGASTVQMQQTLSVYLVVFAAMMLFHGTLSDSFGRRPIVLVNLALFTAASAGCTLASTFEQLLLFRALQGVYTLGMALAMPSLTLIALDLFPQNRGLTASLLGFAHSLVSGIAAGVVSPLLSHDDFTLALGMAALAVTGWIAWAVYARMS